tara:strand:- start:5305 stop:5475 length:171 start_codon:yes stop_codon:yes gene_type:complete
MSKERKSDRQTLIAMLEYIRQSIEPHDTTAAHHIAVAIEHMAQPRPAEDRLAGRLH